MAEDLAEQRRRVRQRLHEDQADATQLAERRAAETARAMADANRAASSRRRRQATDHELSRLFFAWTKALGIPEVKKYNQGLLARRLSTIVVREQEVERLDRDTGDGSGNFHQRDHWLLEDGRTISTDAGRVPSKDPRYGRPSAATHQTYDDLRQTIRRIEERYEIMFPHRYLMRESEPEA
ncbi:hypothetical protein PHK61_19565 [Actinomycetospora lutea]|uniref:hypothetical protein n=1 Tax=Actinomycetospora lutea TaxID=663604 RepID=UPI002367335E|nr:hypothetical protein [Actinomycetospora lutea]MDD7940627.1 hypothetical protein [Actinomycetospora lutea]